MFRKGCRVELIKDVNAIPAGLYSVEDDSEELIILCCGDSILIGLSIDCRPYLRKVAGSVKLSKPHDFLSKYFPLLRQLQGQTYNSIQPLTFCMLDPMSSLNRFYQEKYIQEGGRMTILEELEAEVTAH